MFVDQITPESIRDHGGRVLRENLRLDRQIQNILGQIQNIPVGEPFGFVSEGSLKDLSSMCVWFIVTWVNLVWTKLRDYAVSRVNIGLWTSGQPWDHGDWEDDHQWFRFFGYCCCHTNRFRLDPFPNPLPDFISLFCPLVVLLCLYAHFFLVNMKKKSLRSFFFSEYETKNLLSVFHWVQTHRVLSDPHIFSSLPSYFFLRDLPKWNMSGVYLCVS